MIPSWWAFLLLALAAWRTWLLLAEDTILDRPRRRLPEPWTDWLTCPRCAGFWVALAWWGAWIAWPHGATVAASPLAMSAAVVLLAVAADRE